MIATLAIAGLEASILPHDQFADRRWYRGGGSWHYHGPGQTITDRLSDWGYLQVDPDLREICRMLHRHGLATTPSCQGHFFPRSHFLEIWSVLLRESRTIRGGGLLVRDVVEPGPQLFRDEQYALPWQRANQFVDEVLPQQSTGYLGIAIPVQQNTTLDRMLVACQGPGVQFRVPVLRGDGRFLLGLEVSGGSPAGQSAAWARVRQAIGSLLPTLPSAVA